ncbi:MAG TPA: oxidoreductase [Bacteroidota bacterium]|nr:oxidoreductase [Bacteroidota bacterium]
MSDKPKVGFYWCASCGGCEESIVDLAEDILGVLDAVDIRLWPVAMDFKRSDVEAMADRELAVTFLNGAIRTSEQEEMARILRRKSGLLIAYGSCAHLGGIPGLANQFPREEILRFVYEQSPTTENTEKIRPLTSAEDQGRKTTLPKFFTMVRSLDQIVEVDYYLPGCPPTPKLLLNAVTAILKGELPPKGSVLAPDTALCDECPRRDSKPVDLQIPEFHRPHQVVIDPALCILSQGVVCMGPATRGGCEAACPAGNMPCTGCSGPTSGVADQGAKILSCLAASSSPKEEDEIRRVLEGIPDPVGTFYRYALPTSILRRKRMPAETPQAHQ